MHTEESEIEQGFGHEVAVAHGVEGVLEAAGEAEIGSNRVRVKGERGTRQRPRAQW